MKFTIFNELAGVNVAEYEAVDPRPTYEIDPVYQGSHFVTKDESGTVVSVGNVFRLWSVLEFKRRLTSTERVTIRTIAKQNAVVEDFMDLLDSATEVRSDDQDVIEGLTMLESAGLLGSGRANEIINGD
jgi:hypothetical protein